VCSEEISEDTMYLGTSKHLEISSSSQDIDFGVHADKTTADTNGGNMSIEVHHQALAS